MKIRKKMLNQLKNFFNKHFWEYYLASFRWWISSSCEIHCTLMQAYLPLLLASILVLQYCCWGPCCSGIPVARFSTVTDFPTDSGGPAAVDIHDVPLVPTAAFIPDVTGVPALFGLAACCCWLTTFVSIFSCRPYSVGSPVVAFIPADAGILAVASIRSDPGVPFFSYILTYCTVQ